MSHMGVLSSTQHAELVRGVVTSSAPGRSAIAASWRRSLLHLQLDPQDDARRPRLEAAPIRERQDSAGLLLTLAAPVLARIAAVALDTGSAVLLADAEGVIVDGRIRPTDGEIFDLAGLVVGADWSEASEGTNAIGTTLVDGRPVMISRDQHFFARNLPLVCIGAPVEGPDGAYAGVINISSCRQDTSDIQARLMALAVQDAATQIGAALFQASFAGKRIITLGTDPGHGPSLLAVDRDDLVLGANRAARRALRITAEDVARRAPLADLLGETQGARGDLTRALRSEVTRALQRTHGNVALAARDLGIGRATLYRKMKSLGIEPS